MRPSAEKTLPRSISRTNLRPAYTLTMPLSSAISENFSCLILIDEDNVIKYAQDNKIQFSTYRNLTRKRLNKPADRSGNKKDQRYPFHDLQVKKFTILPKKLYEEDGEVTPTMKVKRKFINEAFTKLTACIELPGKALLNLHAVEKLSLATINPFLGVGKAPGRVQHQAADNHNADFDDHGRSRFMLTIFMGLAGHMVFWKFGLRQMAACGNVYPQKGVNGSQRQFSDSVDTRGSQSFPRQLNTCRRLTRQMLR